MSSGCRVTNALGISVQLSKYAGIYVFWNAPPAAGSEHRLPQTVHCRSPGMTIAGFFGFVFITVFTSFLQDLCFISYDRPGFGIYLIPEGRFITAFFTLRDGATIKHRPQKHRRNRRNRRASSYGGVSTTDRSVICLLFLLKLMCTFWTAALHLRQQMGSGRSFLLLLTLLLLSARLCVCVQKICMSHPLSAI